MTERDRDTLEVDALASDGYIDSLLAARDARTRDRLPDRGVDPAVRDAARDLAGHLGRVHPSFRFEERLAADLQVAASGRRRSGRAARAAVVRRFEPRPALVPRNGTAIDASGTGPAAAGGPVSRPLLIGGALTSAAISLAGAYVAWRHGRPTVDPMVRAVRAAHRAGLTRRIPAGAARLAVQRGTRGR